MASLTYEEKVKTYIKVAFILGAITVVEVLLSTFPHSGQPIKTIVTMAIVTLSCSKAFFVAYYYMHLNHEKKWTIWVAASPVIILIYAGALIADTPSRPVSVYESEPARGIIYPNKVGHHSEGAEHSDSTHETESEHGSDHDAAPEGGE